MATVCVFALADERIIAAAGNSSRAIIHYQMCSMREACTAIVVGCRGAGMHKW